MKLKAILSFLLAVLLAASAFALNGCSNVDTPDDSQTDGTSDRSDTLSDVVSDSGSDPASGSESTAETVDDSVPTVPPENEDLELVKENKTEYILVCDDSAKGLWSRARAFAFYVYEQFDVELTLYNEEEAPADKTKRIVIGDADKNAIFVKNKLNEVNDFAIDVCGDDLFLYATSEYLYEYMLEVAKKEFFTNPDAASELTIAKDEGLIYHSSDYAGQTYAEFVRRNNGGSIVYGDVLLSLFESHSFTAEDGTKIPYRLYIPSSYEQGKTPLMLMLHGAGERGNDNQKQLKNFVPDIFSLENSPYADAIIIAPQCPVDNQWVDTPWKDGNYSINTIAESNELKAVRELIAKIGAEYKPDEDRYYAVGLSMGGFGTWDLIMRTPDLFAAAMPICGGADVSQAAALKELPIRTFHGDKDATVPYAGTKAMSDALTSVGSECFSFTTLTGMGHSIWATVGQDRTNGEWLFARNKKTE